MLWVYDHYLTFIDYCKIVYLVNGVYWYIGPIYIQGLYSICIINIHREIYLYPSPHLAQLIEVCVCVCVWGGGGGGLTLIQTLAMSTVTCHSVLTHRVNNPPPFTPPPPHRVGPPPE